MSDKIMTPSEWMVSNPQKIMNKSFLDQMDMYAEYYHKEMVKGCIMKYAENFNDSYCTYITEGHVDEFLTKQ